MMHVQWVEKYRPQTVEETLLPERIKNDFRRYVENGEIDQNLLLAGSSGIGKTTIAKATLNDMGNEYIFVNASINNGVDIIRHDIQSFASKMSMDGRRKYVILDEADRLSPEAQDGLRAMFEEFSMNTGFIFICNNSAKIIAALRSRLTDVDFTVTNAERQEMAKAFYKRAQTILSQEDVPFDRATLQNIIIKYYPDFRATINALQKAAKRGGVTQETYRNSLDGSFDELIKLVKERDVLGCRTWFSENPDVQSHEFFRRFYDDASELITSNTIPYLIMNIAKYQYQHAFVADVEINMMSFLIECMADVVFK